MNKLMSAGVVGLTALALLSGCQKEDAETKRQLAEMQAKLDAQQKQLDETNKTKPESKPIEKNKPKQVLTYSKLPQIFQGKWFHVTAPSGIRDILIHNFCHQPNELEKNLDPNHNYEYQVFGIEFAPDGKSFLTLETKSGDMTYFSEKFTQLTFQMNGNNRIKGVAEVLEDDGDTEEGETKKSTTSFELEFANNAVHYKGKIYHICK